MAQSLRQIKSRIHSIENIKKLTHAMELISVSKLNRCENTLFNLKQYFLKIASLLENVLSNCKEADNPFLNDRPIKEKIALCVITSDIGLCGAYNHNVIEAAEDFLGKHNRDKVSLVTLGRKAHKHFKEKGFDIVYSYLGFSGRYSNNIADNIFSALTGLFLSIKADDIYIAYTPIDRLLHPKPVLEKFLNLEIKSNKQIDYIFEPDRNRILERLIPAYLLNKIKIIVLNAFVSEHKARAIAMREATENSLELYEALIFAKNKLRQSNITKEMIEIISSQEALKG